MKGAKGSDNRVDYAVSKELHPDSRAVSRRMLSGRLRRKIPQSGYHDRDDRNANPLFRTHAVLSAETVARSYACEILSSRTREGTH